MAKEIKKEPTLYTHYLACTKCSVKFAFDSPHQQNTKIGIDKMKCPVCSKPVMLDIAHFPSSAKPSKTSQAKMNIEASHEARKMAVRAKQEDRESERGIMVPVTSYQEGKGKGKTEMIPKKVIESIKEKVEGEDIFEK